MPPDESPSDLMERLQRQRGRTGAETDAQCSPTDLMEQIKCRNQKRQKEQYGVLTNNYRLLAVLVIGVLIVYAVLFTPFMQYIFPVSEAGPSPNSSETPGVSMNSYLKPAGLDVSKNVTIKNVVLHHDNGHSWLEGEVQNNGNQPVRGVTVYYDLFDAGGRFLGSPYVMAGNIGSGEQKTIRTNPVNGTAATAELTYILGN